MGVVYVLTHKNTGKVYVGYTQQTLDQRWYAHLAQALKAGRRATPIMAALSMEPEAWERRELHAAEDLLELKWVEGFWIEALEATNPSKGFNRKTGGLFCSYSAEAKKTMSDAHLGNLGGAWTEERREKARLYARAPTRSVIDAAIEQRLRPFICVENGKTYRVIKDAADELGLSRACICRQLNGKQKWNRKGYTFKHVEEET